MDQIRSGRFIALKRREKNLTQEQLAEKLGISNKTVSKWENGKCMPDYGIVRPLCQELDITIAELMDGEIKENNSIRIFDEQQVIDMLERIQRLERQKQSLYGMMLIIMGIALAVFSQFFGGTNVRDFISGVMQGISIGEMLIGTYIIGSTLRRS